MENTAVMPTRGRPREFDVDQALAAALRVFWAKGYEGTSLTDLTEAMGITRPSLYAAFGNKEALFKRALDLYEDEKLAYVGRALEAQTARGVAERMLNGAIETIASGCGGCMGVIASVSCSNLESPIREDVQARQISSRCALAKRMERAVSEGDFPEDVHPEAITRFLLAILQGMSVQAGSGATSEQLQQIVDCTLSVWPGR